MLHPISDTSNPHSVTATQVGLGNVCNVGTDSCVTQGSTNNVSSDAVYNAICDLTSCEGTVTVYDSCDNCDIPLALCTDTTSIGKSACCPLTYNPTTGVLSSTCFCGSLDGLVTNATCVCVECVCDNVGYKVALVNKLEEGVCPHQTAKYSSDMSYNPTTGVLSANYFCGTFCGSISNAVCSSMVNTEGVNDNANYDVGLLAVSTGCETALVRYNSTHKITYNPSTCALTAPKINVCCSTIQYNADNQSLEFII